MMTKHSLKVEGFFVSLASLELNGQKYSIKHETNL